MFKEMKRIINLFLVTAIISIAMFVACKDDGKPDSSPLSVDQTELDVMFRGGISVINVSASTAWNASVDADWVKISPISGNGSGQVSVEVDGRDEGTRRTAKITFTAGSAVETVEIRQRGYVPSEYYKTGEVIKLHTHTKGEGIRVIILGDGFDREDCAHGGFYYDMCVRLTDMFLSMPVIRDFTEYFDVWARVDVSRERGARNCVATPDDCPYNAYGSGHADLDWGKIAVNASIASEESDRSIIFMGNGMIGGAAYGDLAVYSANDPENGYWMIHEFAGHVIGHFPDLYAQTFGSGKNDAGFRRMIDDSHANGELFMLDWRNDSATVFWKDFIGRPGYSRVGVYPTGYYSVKFGEVFTCERPELSAMDDRNMYYTVMERYQLWRQIQIRAGIPDPSLNKFIEYDVVNINRGGDPENRSVEGNPLWGNSAEDRAVMWTTDPRVWNWDD
jgi:hypothetical protein